MVDKLKEVGLRHNATAGQVALAWLLAQGDDIIPIPGTKKIGVSVPCGRLVTRRLITLVSEGELGRCQGASHNSGSPRNP